MTVAENGAVEIQSLHQKWLEMVKAQRTSGKSVALWCKENNLSYGQFYGRVQKLKNLGVEIPPQTRDRARPEKGTKTVELRETPREPELREDWLEMVKAQRMSGKSVALWCKENNLSYGQFYGRVQVLKNLGAEIPPQPRGGARPSKGTKNIASQLEIEASPRKPAPKSAAAQESRVTGEKGRESACAVERSAPRTFLVPGVTRGCRSVERLRSIIEYRLGMDPLSGARFVFRGARADTLYMLEWDGDGFVHTRKKKETGFFRWPLHETEVREVTPEQTARLFRGERVV